MQLDREKSYDCMGYQSKTQDGMPVIGLYFEGECSGPGRQHDLWQAEPGDWSRREDQQHQTPMGSAEKIAGFGVEEVAAYPAVHLGEGILWVLQLPVGEDTHSGTTHRCIEKPEAASRRGKSIACT